MTEPHEPAVSGPLTWDDLVTSALLGTARRPIEPASMPGELGRVGGRLPADDPAATLLDAAALWTVWRRAGRTVRATGPLASTSPPDGARIASRAAGSRLGALLSRADSDAEMLLALWLRTAAERGLIAPPAHLPALLELAVRRHELATAVAAVLGERGRWLAQHRPEWRTAVLVDASGSPRATRYAGSGADAAGRPARQPDPALEQQIAERALACVRVERRRLRRTLVVTLPDPTDPATHADTFRAVPHGTGPAAWLLHELVAGTDVRRWPTALDADPDELVQMPVADDLVSTLRSAWTRAACRQRSVAWATALLPGATPGERLELVAVLPPAARVDEAVARLGDLRRRGRDEDLRDVVSVLQSCPRPWPRAVVDAVVEWFASEGPAVPSRVSPVGSVSSVTRIAAAALPVDSATEAATRAAADRLPPDDPRREPILSLADTLLFRRQMTEELR